jgi:Protein of unknown function (DUF2818)
MNTPGVLIYLLLALAIVAANSPFVFERILFVRRAPGGRKAFGWRLLELTLLYLLVGLLARLLEGRQGVVYPQGWEFYAITYCLFLVFAYPGFVYRYMWRRD